MLSSVKYKFEHQNRECVVFYDGQSIPDFKVDGERIPGTEVVPGTRTAMDKNARWWKDKLREYIDANRP